MILFLFLVGSFFALCADEIKATFQIMEWGRYRQLGPVGCRACSRKLEDPTLRTSIGHGAFLCEPCNEVIELEVGLRRPDWFDKPLPPDAEAKKIQSPTTYNCPCCCEEHEADVICLKDLGRYIPQPDTVVAQMPIKRWPCWWCGQLATAGDLCDRCIAAGLRRPRIPSTLVIR